MSMLLKESICLQGMDTPSKNILIYEVFKNVNAQSFKTPTKSELKHDFMWRHYIALSRKRKIGVFNRTYYENVLVTRVHPEYIFNENILRVKSLDDLNDAFYHSGMKRINQFEKHLFDNVTMVLIFLNLLKTIKE